MAETSQKYTAADWDKIRKTFAASIMVNTPLSSLAQNLDGPDWPVKGKEETPAAYIDLGYDEMVTMLTMKGMSPTKADFLISLLKETLAFDDPFGEMVEQTEASSQKDNQLLKNLAKLEIPENFPMTLTAMNADTMQFCKLEKLSTLGEFCVFAQGMSQNVIVGGDFRRLLNAFSHIDEKTLAECLPFRPGTPGLHLLEALVQASKSETPTIKAQQASEWFKAEFESLAKEAGNAVALQRRLMVLGDSDNERRAHAMLMALLRDREPKKRGLFGSLGRIFGK